MKGCEANDETIMKSEEINRRENSNPRIEPTRGREKGLSEKEKIDI